MKIGNININKIKLGIPQIIKVFKGLDLVWSRFLVIIEGFKTRVLNNQGQFEAETCLNTTLENMGIDLFDQASLVITPNAYGENVLYSVTPNDGTGDLSVIRATTGTRVNSEGFIETVPYNLFPQSQTFENSFWFKEASTVTANNIASPSGLMDADYIQETSVLGSHGLRGGTPLNSTNTHTYSVYIKQNGRPGIIFRFGDTNANSQGAYIGSNTFIYSTKTITGTFPANVTELSNGWFRIEIQVTPISQRLGVSHWSYNGATDYYVGDTSKGFYIYGAQLVQGTLPKPYYPTTDRLDIPRIDYTNSTCPNILSEPQRTNLLPRSEEFDNVSWNKSNSSITPNIIISPSGLMDADKLVENDTLNIHDIYAFVGGTELRTNSIFVKAGERSRFILWAGASGYMFDLINLTTTPGNNASSITNTSIQDYGNGWYRCSITSNAGPNNGYRISLLDNETNPATSSPQYQGDGVSGLYIWGAQRENADSLTSYIPTTSAAVTRNADVIRNANAFDLIGQTEGSIFIDFDRTIIPSGLKTILNIYSILLTDFISVSVSNNSITSTNVSIVINGNSISRNFSTIEGRNKIAVVYSTEGTKIFLNGVQLTPINNTGLPVMTVLEINNRNGGRQNGPFRNYSFWKTQITDEQAINLTTL